jgi:hypothetical protein
VVFGVMCLLSVPMLAWITSTFWWRPWGFNSVWYGLTAFGGFSLIAYPVIYVGGLYLYARRLRSLLIRVPEDQRRIQPKLVWLILAVPLNFVGSFYVINRIGRSLNADGRIAAAACRRWSWVGVSWAALQVVAFFPSTAISLIAALMAYATWASHWLDSARIDELLESKNGVVADE